MGASKPLKVENEVENEVVRRPVVIAPVATIDYAFRVKNSK
jgi:hypothetical protein